MTHPTEEEEEAGERPLNGMSERLTLIQVDNDSWFVTTNNSKMHDHPHKFFRELIPNADRSKARMSQLQLLCI